MESTRIILSATWIVLMCIYFLGDILRIISGDVEKGLAGMKMTQPMYFFMALFMLIPIAMILLSLVLPQAVNRWVNMVVAVLLLLFNLAGLKTYPSFYDKFLLVVSMVVNLITVAVAWRWVLPG